MADVIVCEVLCYIANNYADATKHGLLTTVSGFYTSEEIVKAKDVMFNVVDQLRGNGTLPLDFKHRNITHKKGDKKRRQDAEDILAVYADLDVSKILLPMFTAANLQPLSPDATDYCTLAFSVS